MRIALGLRQMRQNLPLSVTPASPPDAGITAPILSDLSSGWTTGDNPPSWAAEYPGAIVYDSDTDTGDKARMRFRMDGGAWTTSADVPLDSDHILSGGWSWPEIGAADLSAGGFFEAQEQVGRFAAGVETATSAWSNIWADTLDALGWSPDALWLATENGDWWDVNDRSKMFQDTAGTSPVTAVGQQIRRWVGQRGNIVLTDTVGLQLLNDGTKDYVYGGGAGAVAKLTSTGAVTAWDASGQLTAFGSFMVSSAASKRELFNADDGTGTRVGKLLATTSAGVIQTTHFNTSGSSQADTGGTVTANTRFTTRAKHKTTSVEVFLNGASDGSTAVSGTLRSNASSIFQVFVSGGTINEGKIYSGFGVVGRVTTTTEDASIDTWGAS